MKIVVHTAVQNEERYLWYALNSVVNYVDEIMIWDLGSIDNTRKIIHKFEGIHKSKVRVRLLTKVDSLGLTEVRQQMIEETKADWIILLDGDEVWWDKSVSKLTSIIRSKGEKLDTIVSKFVNPIGDIYHYQDESAGLYEIDGHKGHLTFRAMNARISGLHIVNPHGKQAFMDGSGTQLQLLNRERRHVLKEHGFMHFTYLVRSSSRAVDKSVNKRGFKYKYELGKSFPLDYYYPESLFRSKPDFVSSPWDKRGVNYVLKSAIQTPIKKLKRSIKIFEKKGY